MAHYVRWHIKDLAEMSKESRKKRFDFICAITGRRGLGKSTLGYKWARRLGFKPKQHIIYTREDLAKGLAGWDQVLMADEAINAGYKRDFHSTDQKDLIKMLNMYRDHRNILFLCIPNFWDLDKPLRDLVKLRIDIVRRGLGVIHKPKESTYSNDPWDHKMNQKIEEKWSKGGVYKPRYSRLSTFVGMIKYGALSPKQEELYQSIKNAKRNEILKAEADSDVKKMNSKYDIVFEKIKQRKLTKEQLELWCELNGLKWSQANRALNAMLKDDPKVEGTLKDHFIVTQNDTKNIVNTNRIKNGNKRVLPYVSPNGY